MDSEDEEEGTAGGGMMGQLGALTGGGGVPALPGMPGVPAVPGLPVPGLPGLTGVGGALPPPSARAAPELKDKAKDEPPPPPPEDEPEEEAGSNALVAQFFVKESGALAEILFVPNGIRLGGPKLKDFFEKQWKLAAPSTMLSCDAGTVHPKQFAAIGLAQLPSFEVFWADANQHAERAGRTEGQEVRACACARTRTARTSCARDATVSGCSLSCALSRFTV